jgi:hypothetical protein
MITHERFLVRVPVKKPVIWPERKAKAMTIGIGMLCEGGAVIASDTRAVYSDGSTSNIRKIRTAISQNAAYVAAFASGDVPATETLLSDIFSDLRQRNRTTLAECEDTVRFQMAKWDASHPHGAPDTEFLFAVALPNEHALYHCRPPNSMNQKSYFAIGQGAAITDPIRNIFFQSRKGPKTTLRQIAYLMYRAKNDYGSACGGLTNAVFIKSGSPSAFEITSSSMSMAEHSSVWIDGALRETLASIFSGALPTETRIISDAVGYWKGKVFLTDARQVIEDEGSIRQLLPPDFSLE